MTPARLAPSLPATALAGRDLHPQDIDSFAQRTPNEVLEPLWPEQNLPNGPLLEAKFSRRGLDSTDWGGKSIFPRFRAYQSLGDQMLTNWKPKNPRPALIGSDEPEENLRPLGHTTCGHGNGPDGK